MSNLSSLSLPCLGDWLLCILSAGQTNATPFNNSEFNFVGWCWTAWPNNATCCLVQTQIVEIRDLRLTMILNVRPIYLLPLLKRGLATCAQMQQCWSAQPNESTLVTHENKRNVLLKWCCIKCLKEIKLHSASYNIQQHGGQTSSTHKS